MFGSISRIVDQFKQGWSRGLEDDAVRRACEEAGHKWRERDLGPVVTVRMFLLQILYGNQTGIQADIVLNIAKGDYDATWLDTKRGNSVPPLHDGVGCRRIATC